MVFINWVLIDLQIQFYSEVTGIVWFCFGKVFGVFVQAKLVLWSKADNTGKIRNFAPRNKEIKTC